MIRTHSSTALSLLVLSLVLVGCEPKDKDLVMDFAKEWGKLHGLYNEDGSLTGKAIGRGLAPDWAKPDIKDKDGNVDQAGNAAVDAGVVVKSIVDNDKIADEAMDALKKQDDVTALKKINMAVRARPNDWYYLNRRGTIYAATGETGKAGADFNAAVDLCKGGKRCLDAVERDRASLLGG